MPDPFRLRVMMALTAALQEITPANGYAHDLSASVFRGRTVFGETDPLPMVSVLEPAQPAEALDTRENNNVVPWDLYVQGFVEGDYANPTDPAYRLLADVTTRLGIETVRRDDGRNLNPLGMGGGKGSSNEILKLTIGSAVVRPPDDVSAKAYFWLSITFDLVEDVEKPFA